MSRNFGEKSDWKAVTWTLAREMIIKYLELFYTRKQIDKTEKMIVEEKESEERGKEIKTDRQKERKKETFISRNFVLAMLAINGKFLAGRQFTNYRFQGIEVLGTQSTVIPSSLTSSYLGAEIIRVTDLPGSVPTFDCRTL